MSETVVGFLGGTGVTTLLRDKNFHSSRIGPKKTPFGESQPIFRLGDDVFLLSRRGELGARVTPTYVNYRANIWALKELGVNCAVGWSGVGSINMSYRLGSIVLADDLIDETHLRTCTFLERSDVGGMKQNPVFCPTLAKTLCDSLRELDISSNIGGTYACIEGPRLGTPAEVRKYAALDVDVIGQTLCPEIFLAKELEMCYHSLLFVISYAEGIRHSDFKEHTLFEDLGLPETVNPIEVINRQMPRILGHLIPKLKALPGDCHCRSLMKKYRDRGILDKDFHKWIE